MVLVMVSDKGGVGKSTLAVSIATEWMARNLNVLLVDADETESAADMCKAARAAGLLAPSVVSGTSHLRQTLLRAREHYQHIIIDTPGHVGDVQRAALLCSDVALVPVSSTAADIRTTDRMAKSVNLIRQDNASLRGAFVLAKLLPTAVIGRVGRERLKGSGMPVFKSRTFTRASWAEVSDVGQGVAQYEPESEAADELRALVAELERFHRGGVTK